MFKPRLSLKGLFVLLTVAGIFAGVLTNVRLRYERELTAVEQLRTLGQSSIVGTGLSIDQVEKNDLPVWDWFNAATHLDFRRIRYLGIYSVEDKLNKEVVNAMKSLEGLVELHLYFSDREGCVIPFDQWIDLTSVSIPNFPISVEECHLISQLPRIQRLDLSDNELTDDHLLALTHASQLRFLDVASNSKITARGMMLALKLPNLELVNFSGCANLAVDGELDSAFENRKLESLALHNTPLTDASIRALAARFPNLRFLGISGTGVTDACIPFIERFASLERLDISNTRVSAIALTGRLDKVAYLHAFHLRQDPNWNRNSIGLRSED